MQKITAGGKTARSFLLFGLFIVLLGLGIVAGEFRAVLEKAVNVCLSCVGIG